MSRHEWDLEDYQSKINCLESDQACRIATKRGDETAIGLHLNLKLLTNNCTNYGETPYNFQSLEIHQGGRVGHQSYFIPFAQLKVLKVEDAPPREIIKTSRFISCVIVHALISPKL